MALHAKAVLVVIKTPSARVQLECLHEKLRFLRHSLSCDAVRLHHSKILLLFRASLSCEAMKNIHRIIRTYAQSCGIYKGKIYAKMQM
jgi:hypothetical protein